MINANEDVRDGLLSRRLTSLGLVSVLQNRFGRNTMSPAFQRGSMPIDDIFVSTSISASRAGTHSHFLKIENLYFWVILGHLKIFHIHNHTF